MAAHNFQFKAIGPYRWQGRYKRIPGDTSTFKLRFDSRRGWWPCIEWDTEEGRLVCFALGANRYVERLVSSVNDAKKRLSRTEGGSFVINEFGQVIVPSRDGDGRRLIVGETNGVLLFENPLDDELIDLSETDGLEPGVLWDRPYIGQAYQLHGNSKIYYFDDREGKMHFPHVQDIRLIRSFRRFRRTGPLRFVVNPYGIVLIKCPVGEFNFDEDEYKPIYIGRIDKKQWFIKEEDYERV